MSETRRDFLKGMAALFAGGVAIGACDGEKPEEYIAEAPSSTLTPENVIDGLEPVTFYMGPHDEIVMMTPCKYRDDGDWADYLLEPSGKLTFKGHRIHGLSHHRR